MKTKVLLSVLLLSATVLCNAQLQVMSNGIVKAYNQTAIFSNINNTTGDLVDIIDNNGSLASEIDLLWGIFRASQPNNPGLLTLMSVDGAMFSVRANGRVGIFNHDPSCALEVGTAGQNEQIKVNGSIVLTSDERLKDNIKDLTNSLSQLKQLRTVTYIFKMPVVAQKAKVGVDTTGIKKPLFNPKPDSSGRKHYGFLAQDVQKTFPDLVYKDSTGMLSVDYIGMIPLLVDALRNQQAQIDTQAKQIAELTNLITNPTTGPKKVGASQTPAPSETDALTYPVLDQNVPNPFNSATTIGFYLPTTVTNANIYVYDMNGIQLKSYLLTERGKGNLVIQGSEFNAGMYLYALIADGKVIDTKRMILTK